MTNATPQRRFDIALSFPGEHRPFVEQVATQLAATFSQDRVLYDKYHDAEFARLDLDVYLPNLYRTESELLVIFLCAEYAAKRWCKLEWRFIRQLIATLDAGRIMFLSFGNPGDLSQIGILSGDGHIEIGAQSAEVIAEKIRKRLNLNRGVTAPAPTVSIPADISRIVKYAPAELIGREAELKLLDDAWDAPGTHRLRRADVADKPAGGSQAFEQNDSRPEALRTPMQRPHIVTFVALGGEGKTSLVAKWATALAAQDWPGCEAVFAWSFYSQGTREQVAASSDLFLKAALDFFGDADDREFAASSAGAYEKGERLARVVGRRRCLLILDGLEPLQYAPSAPTPGELKDQGVAALLKKLAADNRGLCLVTTRYALPDLRAFLNQTVREEPLLRLSRAAGVHLLKTLGVRGSELRNLPLKDGDAQSEQVNEFEKLVEDVKGHALTLTLLGGFLRRAYRGDIRQRDRVQFTKADEKMDGGHALRTMAVYEQWLLRDGGGEGRREVAVLRLLGLFDRPADAGCLAALMREPVIPDLTEPLVGLAADDWEFALSGLEAARLLTVNRDAAGALIALDAHPLLREYFTGRMKDEGGRMKEGEALSLIPYPSSFQLAHRRLYEHLCATTKEGDQPALEDLQPLYQAVAHGCKAGLEREVLENVLIRRIFRGTGDFGNFTMYQMGAIGSDLVALSHFFTSPWKSVSTSIRHDLDIWTLSAVAFRLRAVGRIAEAIDPIVSAFELAMDRKDNWQAAIRASLVCETRLLLGEITAAITIGEEAIKLANSQEEVYWRIANRSALADALFQSGDIVQAQRLSDSSTMDQGKAHAECQPSYLRLQSVGGFRYCERLLSAAEFTSWREWTVQSLAVKPKKDQGRSESTADLLAACSIVSEQATKMLESDRQFGRLVDFGLHHLTLGRAVFYKALLAGLSIEACRAPLDQAISGLRRAARQDYLPHGLLTRAWFRSRSGVPTGPDSAQTDLDEAWEIASRGPMRLFMADIHLYRTRLFGLRNADFGLRSGVPYPWESPEHDLAEAERLIKECGYHRRDEELADAKRAILGTGLA